MHEAIETQTIEYNLGNPPFGHVKKTFPVIDNMLGHLAAFSVVFDMSWETPAQDASLSSTITNPIELVLDSSDIFPQPPERSLLRRAVDYILKN